MASIRKNPSGTYTATIYVGRDSKGKMLRKYVTRDTWKECKDAAREIEQDIADKKLSNMSMMKMSKYMDKWLEVNKPFLAPTTIRTYKMYIDRHFKPAFGNMKVYHVTEMHIKEYIAEKMDELSSTTVRKHFFTLKKMFYDALKGKSPCLEIKPPKNSDFKPTIPTEEEFKKIHQAFQEIGLQDEAIILLAGWCGLRRGEIFALKWDDINEEEGTMRIDEAVALEEEGYEFEYKEPKSRNSIRTIAAPDYLIDLLKQLKLKPKNKNKQKDKDIQHEVFTYNPHTFTKKYAKIIKEKGLPKVRFHDLRHYHASLLYKNNVPDLYAAERLGHDIWVLKKIYQHLGLEEKRELDEKVKNMFKQ